MASNLRGFVTVEMAEMVGREELAAGAARADRARMVASSLTPETGVMEATEAMAATANLAAVVEGPVPVAILPA